MFSIKTLLISPFLPGLIFILVSFIMKYFPPAHINSIYGYRTRKSMLNEQNWKMANTYATLMLLRTGVVLLLTGILLSLFITNIKLLSILTPVAAVAGGLVVFFLTEKRLQ